MKRSNRMAPVDFEDLNDRKAAYEAAGTERTKAVRNAPRNMFSVPVAGNKTYDATGLVAPTVAPAASAPTGDVTKTDAASFTSVVEEVPVAASRRLMPGGMDTLGGAPKPGRPMKKRNTPMFAINARGEGVGELQQFLSDKGFYDGSINNAFGAQTEEAVKAYQREKGLTVDGMVGTNTMDAIKADMAGDSPAAAPAAPMAAAPAVPAAPEPAVAATESRAGRMTPGAQLRKIRSGEMVLRAEDLPRDQNVLEFLVTQGLVDVDTATSAGYRPKSGAMKKKVAAAASRPTATASSTASGQRAPTAAEINMMNTEERRYVIDSGRMTAAEMANVLLAGTI